MLTDVNIVTQLAGIGLEPVDVLPGQGPIALNVLLDKLFTKILDFLDIRGLAVLQCFFLHARLEQQQNSEVRKGASFFIEKSKVSKFFDCLWVGFIISCNSGDFTLECIEDPVHTLRIALV